MGTATHTKNLIDSGSVFRLSTEQLSLLLMNVVLTLSLIADFDTLNCIERKTKRGKLLTKNSGIEKSTCKNADSVAITSNVKTSESSLFSNRNGVSMNESDLYLPENIVCNEKEVSCLHVERPRRSQCVDALTVHGRQLCVYGGISFLFHIEERFQINAQDAHELDDD